MSEREQQTAQAPQPVSISQRLGRLQFHKSGKFRVLQFTDVQDGPHPSPDTLSLIEAAVREARPDVVVFPGNLIAGYDPAYKATYRQRTWAKPRGTDADLAHTRELVRGFLTELTAPLARAGVPWAATFGNHDFQCGLSNAELNEICCGFRECLNPRVFPGELDDDHCKEIACAALPDELEYVCEPGTFALPVAGEDGRALIGLALVDSGNYAPTGGYGSPDARALAFLKELPRKLGAPSIVFQHTPLPQYYDLLDAVPAKAAGAVEGYRAHAGQHYALDDARVEDGSYLGEGISCPDDDSGEFQILKDGGYFAISTGQDHRNGFVGTADGLRMAASPTCGFNSYGPVPARRAARLFEFDHRHPTAPRTQLLEFGELVGKPTSKKAYVYGMTADSKPKGEGVDLLHHPTAMSRLLNRIGAWFQGQKDDDRA
ncbi:MAG: metallophosphoesterase [Bifidobacterium sp.]|nr:metallophosphoesterase [Bifidobacterium sp.]